MSEYIAASPTRYLPQMLLATTVVAVLPLSTSLVLRSLGVITSAWASMALAVAISLAASSAGSAYWRKRGTACEVVFSELLLWGWLRRWRQERQLAHATRLLHLARPGARVDDAEMSVQRREQLLRQLAAALEGQDLYLNGHSHRVARLATMIARGMGLPSEEVARVRAAAAVHDVGKLRTPKQILNKPDRLTEAEFAVIKLHPVDGAEMVAALSDPELTRIVRHHHERLDGAGYPDGLAGDHIPLGARIIAVADTFDAITSARPYRPASRHQKAIDVLRREAGSQLDPAAVRAFLAYYSGKRPAVVWAMATSMLRRVVAWLTGDPAAAATISTGKLAAATAATAALGVAAGAPVAVVNASHASRAPAQIGAARPADASAHGRRVIASFSGTVPLYAKRASRDAPPRPARRTRRTAGRQVGRRSSSTPAGAPAASRRAQPRPSGLRRTLGATWSARGRGSAVVAPRPIPAPPASGSGGPPAAAAVAPPGAAVLPASQSPQRSASVHRQGASESGRGNGGGASNAGGEGKAVARPIPPGVGGSVTASGQGNGANASGNENAQGGNSNSQGNSNAQGGSPDTKGSSNGHGDNSGTGGSGQSQAHTATAAAHP